MHLCLVSLAEGAIAALRILQCGTAFDAKHARAHALDELHTARVKSIWYHISPTNPTSTKFANGRFSVATLLLQFSLTHKKVPSRIRLTKL